MAPLSQITLSNGALCAAVQPLFLHQNASSAVVGAARSQVCTMMNHVQAGSKHPVADYKARTPEIIRQTVNPRTLPAGSSIVPARSRITVCRDSLSCAGQQTP